MCTLDVPANALMGRCNPSRCRAALHGDMRPGCAFNRPNQSADDPATGHDILPTGPDLRPVRKLPLATGLPIILNSNQLGIDFTDAERSDYHVEVPNACCCLCVHQSAWAEAECTCGAGYRA